MAVMKAVTKWAVGTDVVITVVESPKMKAAAVRKAAVRKIVGRWAAAESLSMIMSPPDQEPTRA
jgi:hypothetical protein